MSQENLQSNKPLIIYGPEGCGKTRYAQVLARHFGKEIIIDGLSRYDAEETTLNALYLTNEDLSDSDDSRAIPFHVAAKAAGIKLADHSTLPDSEPQRRYCKDCQYFDKHRTLNDGFCSHPSTFVIDLVTGPQKQPCRYIRKDNAACGIQGKLFSPKNVNDFSNSRQFGCNISVDDL